MGDIMRAIPLRQLVNWILLEYGQDQSIFGIPKEKFFRRSGNSRIKIFGEAIETPVGPAAGPHTQLAQNIVAAYLCGGRFFELKTVQILDNLEIAKPCIVAQDECYNTEWSTELTIEGALEEYVKAWFLLHVLHREIYQSDERPFIFNMSVGYDLEGIKSPKVDKFIERLKDASQTEIFQQCRAVLKAEVDRFKFVDATFIDSISPNICSSVTLSTLHGCPPEEIEAIAKYLMAEKKLHTFVKLNPTLLGYEYVRNTFDKMGYNYIHLKEESFTHDLQYDDGVAMLRRLKDFASDEGKTFGVKLSNTLPVKITRGELPGEEMYMSGRALYPLTINLAFKLTTEFDGKLMISYSGGADFFNIVRICETGIMPITVATTLLKPGGYSRLKQMAEALVSRVADGQPEAIDLAKLEELAESAIEDRNHLKEKRTVSSRKIAKKLPLTDCFAAPCTVGCPIGQDIPEYIRLVGEGKYDEAFQVIVSKNPLPFITGTICSHPCMTKCTRLDYDDPVFIREMKRLAAEKGYRVYLQKAGKTAGQSFARVAIIGAGPSGLAAGYFLARAGMDVTIFDKKERPGGLVENVIPDFRIPREAIQKDIELIQKTGVKFKLGMDPDFSVQELKDQGFDYIYLAIGAGKSNPLKLETGGQRGMAAVDFLEQFNRNRKSIKLGKSVVVIGGGNTAMDAARAALRVEGVEQVYIVYRRTKEYMPADPEELRAAQAEGVILKELLLPLALTDGVLKCQQMKLGEPDASGRRSPVAKEGQFEELKVDMVLSATGEVVDYEILGQNGIEVDAQGRITIDSATNETNIENVFIGGDALTGPATVVEAIAQGSKVAKAIIAKENSAQVKGETLPVEFDQEKILAEITNKKGILAAFAAGEQEPSRCLECNFVCNICTEVCPNRANIAVKVASTSLVNQNQIIHVDRICNECGNCETFCPYNGAPYKDKLTLFWNEGDFNNSENNGFLLLEDCDGPSFKLRTDGSILNVKFDATGKANASVDGNVLDVIWATYKKYKYLLVEG